MASLSPLVCAFSTMLSISHTLSRFIFQTIKLLSPSYPRVQWGTEKSHNLLKASQQVGFTANPAQKPKLGDSASRVHAFTPCAVLPLVVRTTLFFLSSTPLSITLVLYYLLYHQRPTELLRAKTEQFLILFFTLESTTWGLLMSIDSSSVPVVPVGAFKPVGTLWHHRTFHRRPEWIPQGQGPPHLAFCRR